MESHRPVKKDEMIPVKKIKYVSQEKFIPVKLNKFKKNPELLDIPIDVLFDKDGFYHVMDGHHRFLAALNLDKIKIKANVYRSVGLGKA